MNRILLRTTSAVTDAAPWLRDWAMYLIGATEGVAGCCGCGEPVINVALVDLVKGREVPGETWCWDCWGKPCTGMPWAYLAELDHIELPRPLVEVPWREADQVVRDLIAERQVSR